MPIMQYSRIRLALCKHWPILLILVAFALLCTAYSATVPLGETPDELAHYQYVRYIDLTGHPPLTAAERQLAGYKGHEPPLYYLLVHRITAFMNVGQQPMLKLMDPDLQPRHSIGAEVMLWDTVLHTADESFPWYGASLAWHLLRLLSIFLGMVTVFCTYSMMYRLFPQRPALALAAAGINAFMPQFVFISSAMNNDNLAVPLSVLSLCVLVRLASGDLRWRWFVLLGVLIGLARITKFYTLTLLPVLGVSLVLIAWFHRCWRRCLTGGVLALGLIFVVSAPWILAVQPDDPALAPQGVLGFGLKMLDILHTDRALRSAGMSVAGGGWVALAVSFLHLEPWRWAETLFRSFWAYFGPMTVEAGRGIYLALAGLSALASFGSLWVLVRPRRWRHTAGSGDPRSGQLRLTTAILGIQAFACVLVEAIFYTLMRRLPDTAQGRHLYPAMPAWMGFLAVGLLAWMPRRAGRWGAWALSLGFMALTAYCLPTYVLAAYEPVYPVRTVWPTVWRPQVAQQRETAPGIVFLGYSPALVQVAAGGAARLTFVWQATTPIEPEYLLRISYVDGEGTERLLHLAHPAGGRWPTRAWDPGDYIRDEYSFTIPPGLPAGHYALRAQWVGYDLHPVGAPLDAGMLRVAEQDAPLDAMVGEAQGKAIRLVGTSGDLVRYRQTMVVTTWAPEGERPPSVQWVSKGQQWPALATQDYPSRNGATTTRSFYLVTGHTLPGRYALLTGEGVEVNPGALPLTVKTRARHFAIPGGYASLRARLGERIVLEGYRLQGVTWSGQAHPRLGSHYPTLKAGQTLDLGLAWRASNWIPRSYIVFTHLLDEQGTIRAQHDQTPQFNYATLFWVPGEVVEDVYHLALPTEAPAGIYQLEVGLYSRADNSRLPVNGPTGQADTRVILPPILVTGP